MSRFISAFNVTPPCPALLYPTPGAASCYRRQLYPSAPRRLNVRARQAPANAHAEPSANSRVFVHDGRTYEAISWAAVERLAAILTCALDRDDWDVVLAITRGGLAPAALVAEGLELRNVLAATVMFYTDEGDAFFGLRVPRFLAFPPAAMLHGQRVLIVDDVWDTGATAVAVRERVRRAGAKDTAVAVLHFKEANSQGQVDKAPDYFAEITDKWILYPWEVLARRILGIARAAEDSEA